jgi:cathepsin B
VACWNLDEEYLITPELVAKINSNPESTWVAGMNPVFAGKKFSEVKVMLGALLVGAPQLPKTKFDAKVTLPDSFDTYTQWPNCKHPIRDQGQCGSCWAFSAAEAISDRFCIAGEDMILSPQDLVSCESDEYACQGGYLAREWQFMEQTGIVTDSCFPYVSGSGIVPRCPTTCKDGTTWTTHKVKTGSTIQFDGPDSAMQNMYQYGSVQAAFTVYQDFFSYKSGVYYHQTGTAAGGHAVKAQGWGVDNGTPYWIVANSWGTGWGMDGYFWIKRGNDECGFEDQMFAGMPLTD